jgi:hypothetical protein
VVIDMQSEGVWFDQWRKRRDGNLNLARALYDHAITIYRAQPRVKDRKDVALTGKITAGDSTGTPTSYRTVAQSKQTLERAATVHVEKGSPLTPVSIKYLARRTHSNNQHALTVLEDLRTVGHTWEHQPFKKVLVFDKQLRSSVKSQSTTPLPTIEPGIWRGVNWSREVNEPSAVSKASRHRWSC